MKPKAKAPKAKALWPKTQAREACTVARPPGRLALGVYRGGRPGEAVIGLAQRLAILVCGEARLQLSAEDLQRLRLPNAVLRELAADAHRALRLVEEHGHQDAFLTRVGGRIVPGHGELVRDRLHVAALGIVEDDDADVAERVHLQEPGREAVPVLARQAMRTRCVVDDAGELFPREFGRTGLGARPAAARRRGGGGGGR